MKSIARVCAVLLFGTLCSSFLGCNGQSESKTIATPSGEPSGATGKPGDAAAPKKGAMQPPGP
jgi:hypothetical protein